MRNIFVALVLSLASLSASAGLSYVDSWAYDDENPTLIMTTVKGTKSDISVHVHQTGEVSFTWLPVNYNGSGLDYSTVSREKRVINVNGQNINFMFSFFKSGYISAEPVSRAGHNYLLEQAKKARYFDISGPDWGATVSMIGFKKAWSFIQSKKAI